MLCDRNMNLSRGDGTGDAESAIFPSIFFEMGKILALNPSMVQNQKMSLAPPTFHTFKRPC